MTRLDDSAIWQQDHSSLEHSVNIGQWSLATCLTGGRREEAGCGGQEGPSLLLKGPEVAGMSKMFLWHMWRPPTRGSDSTSPLAVNLAPFPGWHLSAPKKDSGVFHPLSLPPPHVFPPK